jgi:hypothetical protein
MFVPGDNPDWILLPVAVAIVMAGRRVDADASKFILREARADRRLQIRLVELVDGKPVYHMDFPAELNLDDGEWERSRPENPLRRASEHSWWDQWIECFRADVESIGRVWPADMSQLLRLPTIEEQAVRKLASHYKTLPELKNDDAFAWCKDNGFPDLSERGFYERVRPEARRIAGLEEKARPGPKRSPR